MVELRKEAHLSSPKVAKMSLKWKERVKEKRENREAELEMQTVLLRSNVLRRVRQQVSVEIYGELGCSSVHTRLE